MEIIHHQISNCDPSELVLNENLVSCQKIWCQKVPRFCIDTGINFLRQLTPIDPCLLDGVM